MAANKLNPFKMSSYLQAAVPGVYGCWNWTPQFWTAHLCGSKVLCLCGRLLTILFSEAYFRVDKTVTSCRCVSPTETWESQLLRAISYFSHVTLQKVVPNSSNCRGGLLIPNTVGLTSPWLSCCPWTLNNSSLTGHLSDAIFSWELLLLPLSSRTP